MGLIVHNKALGIMACPLWRPVAHTNYKAQSSQTKSQRRIGQGDPYTCCIVGKVLNATEPKCINIQSPA